MGCSIKWVLPKHLSKTTEFPGPFVARSKDRPTASNSDMSSERCRLTGDGFPTFCPANNSNQTSPLQFRNSTGRRGGELFGDDFGDLNNQANQ